jgi:hypothetical protein
MPATSKISLQTHNLIKENIFFLCEEFDAQ